MLRRRLSPCSIGYSVLQVHQVLFPNSMSKEGISHMLTNSLAHTHPHLAAEYTDDNERPPDEIAAGTHKRLTWVCKKCFHKWEASGSYRLRGYGCPACVNRVVNNAHRLNSLAYTHPQLAAEYASDNELAADQVLVWTHKKLKWVCGKCSYPWLASGAQRLAGHGCPNCAHKAP